MAMISFAVLGPVEIVAGGRAVDVGGDRQRRILAALLLNLGRILRMPYLIEVVWCGDPPDTARQQIHNGVWRLRRGLARHGYPGVLRSEADGYRLRAEPPQLDLNRFQTGVLEGRRLARHGRITEAAAHLREAISLWRGPPLAGLTGGPGPIGGPLEREAVRLEEMRLTAVEDSLEYALACGGEGELVAELTGLVAQYPLRERLPNLLMLALYRLGRQAEAMAVYRRTATVLAEELGVDPGPELRQRYEAMLHGDPALYLPGQGFRSVG